MRLLAKLKAAHDAIGNLILLLDDGPEELEEEAEILLTRSMKNRRSDQNEVMTLAPLNGAPAVPESWATGRGNHRGASPKNRQVLARIMTDYEPMTRRDVWTISRELDPRLQKIMPQKNFQQMVNRMVRQGKLVLKRDKLVMGA